jgi:N6-L-threonylcarbamoyladenine synthase
MLRSGDLDFSFSGLKTAVRYAIADKTLSLSEKQALARDFEDVVITVLTAKVKTAIETYGAQSVILGGGVSANTELRKAMKSLSSPLLFPHLSVYLPEIKLSTDNSIMIALAGHAHLTSAQTPEAFARDTKADGNKSIENTSRGL